MFEYEVKNVIKSSAQKRGAATEEDEDNSLSGSNRDIFPNLRDQAELDEVTGLRPLFRIGKLIVCTT